VKTDPSVTIQIRGGIGNQLFMYAMVRRLSLVNSVPLYLETHSGFQGDYFQRDYGLNVFNISGYEIVTERRSNLRRRGTIVANRMLPFSRRGFFREEPGRFDQRFLDLKVGRPVFLEGYWQDERYFADIRSVLQCDLKFLRQHSDAHESLARKMRGSESVAVHVRQLQGPAGIEQPSDATKSLPGEYYRSAVQRIKERVPNPEFYLFSDSSSVAAIPGADESLTRIENTGPDAQYDDLFLMSQCRHFVLANSTFSWWGAWLGKMQESMIVSPAMREWGQLVQIPDEWHALEWSRKNGLSN